MITKKATRTDLCLNLLAAFTILAGIVLSALTQKAYGFVGSLPVVFIFGGGGASLIIWADRKWRRLVFPVVPNPRHEKGK